MERLGHPEMGFNIDSGAPPVLIVGATGADRWHADVHGKSSHAGVHPEHGISAALIASRAVADVAARGYFGKIELPGGSGTSNVGRMAGGEASNQVTDHVFVSGESRSHDKAFLAEITAAWRDAFERAARSVANSDGARGRVDFRAETDYDAFEMPEDSPPVRLAAEQVCAALGVEAEYLVANGGLDANYLNAKGVPPRSPWARASTTPTLWRSTSTSRSTSTAAAWWPPSPRPDRPSARFTDAHSRNDARDKADCRCGTGGCGRANARGDGTQTRRPTGEPGMNTRMLHEKTIVVTGAGRGIGRDIALLAASHGASVVVNDLGGSERGDGADRTPAQAVVDEILAAGGRAAANYENVADFAGAGRAIEQALDEFGQIDGVVNNAGILRDVIFHKMERERLGRRDRRPPEGQLQHGAGRRSPLPQADRRRLRPHDLDLPG